tara:strand:+ start:1673 stop:2293 length:621 start_codon:yes stop_codon:yes gene_type:complete
VIEEMYAGDGEKRTAYHRGTDEFRGAVSSLEETFGTQPHEMWKSISTSQYNSIYEDNIVSIVNLVQPAYLASFNPVAVGRKFFTDNKWIYDKIYTLTTPSDCTLPSPSGAIPLFIGELVNVYGQAGDSDLTAYKCLYFKCDNHNAVETWSGVELGQGSYNTFYSATFDTNNDNQRLRMKSYAYNSAGAFTDWDDIWTSIATFRGIT